MKASKFVFIIVLFLMIVSCQSEDSEPIIKEPTVTETLDLTHFPFGDVSSTNILIRRRCCRS